jgi:glucokinase
MLLAGDIGGTKAQLALFEPGGSPRRPAFQRKLPSRDYASLEALVHEFLSGSAARPSGAVIGIAGPVVKNRSEATNLPWVIDGARLSEALDGAEVMLMNDLEATAWGLPLLEPAEFRTLQRGKPESGNRALIAAGTGLGEALMVWNGKDWRPTASEGGHSDFAARNDLEDELNQWLRAKYGRVSYERVLSGPGIADLYRFMSATGRGEEPAGFAERFEAAPDPAPVVTQGALDGSCARARLALECFTEVYGAEAGNLALKSLAVGGVYIGGGIAPRILPFFDDARFIKAFTDKGRLTPMLEQVPVHVILDPATALWGAAAVVLAGVQPPARERAGLIE